MNKLTKEEKDSFINTIVNLSQRWKKPVATTVEALEKFCPAEQYHQDYLQKNPKGYTYHMRYFNSYLEEE